jgi:hypothetical protein
MATVLAKHIDISSAVNRTACGGPGRLAFGDPEHLQNQLWAHAVTVAENNPTSIVVGLFAQSLNEVIDLHAKRVTAGLRNRIPGAIWVALFAVAVLSLAAMGYHAGLSRTSRSLAELAVLHVFCGHRAHCRSRPTSRRVLKVSQQALIDLRQSMPVPKPLA